MDQWPDGNHAVLRIVAIRDQFLKSITRTQYFLGDAESGFAKKAELLSSVRTKLAAAQRGEVLETPPEHVPVDLEWDEVDALKDATESTLAIMDHYPGMLAEMALVYLFANYDAFLSDLLAEMYRTRPEMLRSGRQISAEAIVNAASLDDLVEELISRELREWRIPFRGQMERIDQRFGATVCATHASAIEVVAEAHERRHLFVHRGGVVDARYVGAVPRTEAALGSKISADPQYWEAVSSALSAIVESLCADLPVRCLGIAPETLQAGEESGDLRA